MASEIKVDTISEKTSAGGVTIDGLLIKDGGISGDVSLIGTTPTFTIGDAGAEDAALVFDGNAQDFYIALDDSEDDLVIGLGSTVGTTPAIAIDANLKVNIPVTTASTSASTGSLTTGGGMGVGADLYVGDDTYLITDSAVLGFGADKDTTLTHTDGTGLTLNSTNKLCFNDATQFVQGISGTVLGLGATDEIDLTATAVDLNGTLDVSGTSQFNGLMTLKPGSNIHQLKLEQDNGTDYWSIHCDSSGGTLTFQRYTGGAETEKFRCLSNGTFIVGKTSADDTLEGHTFPAASPAVFTVDDDNCIIGNRQSDDGSVISIKQANSQEGSISVSGTTVAYGTFCGTHWSRLADNSKPTILRGTVIESIATMIDWYKAKFTYDDNEITEEIALPDGKSVGDSIKHTYHDVEYDAIIEKQDNEQLPMCKISDTTDSKAVYGVFMDWDNEPDDGVNDMYVAALGSFVVRINSGETVAIGDYLQSNGDGTAKVQADDILRASTIGKVTSTEKTHIHADDSYCVPCTLHCG